MTAWFQSTWMGPGFGWFLATLILILLIALPLMLAVAMIIYAERKIWAAIALRRGPNVVGPWGLLQSFADGLKVFLKETIIPSSANKGLFLIAPIITFTVALIVWAVVPFDVGVVLTDINVGLLYLLAVSSLGVYGVIIAGWASNETNSGSCLAAWSALTTPIDWLSLVENTASRSRWRVSMSSIALRPFSGSQPASAVATKRKPGPGTRRAETGRTLGRSRRSG